MSRRNFTNQFGAFVPTETEAINNIEKKPKKKPEEIKVKKYSSVLREDGLKQMDKHRKKPFHKWIKEEIKEEEMKHTVYEEELKNQEKIYETLKKAKQRAYYQEHKESFLESQRQYRKRHPEKIKEYQAKYYERNKMKKGNSDTGNHYIDIDGIRLVKDGKKIVGWYRPDGWEQNDEID